MRIRTFLLLLGLLGALLSTISGCIEASAKQLTYNLEYQSVGISDLSTISLPGVGSGSPQMTTFETKFAGSVQIVEVPKLLNTRLVFFQPSSLEISVQGKRNSQQETAAMEALRKPLLAALDESGYIQHIQFPKEINYAPREFARQMLSYLYYSGPKSKDISTWTREEAIGGYRQLVSYRKDGEWIERSRIGSSPVGKNTNVIAAAPSEQIGTIRYAVASNGSMKTAEGELAHSLRLNGKKVGSDRVRWSARLAKEDSNHQIKVEEAVLALKDSKPLGLSEYRETPDQKAARLLSQVRDWTPENGIQRLRRLVNLPNIENRTPAKDTVALAALCQLDPTFPNKMLAEIESSPVSSSACQIGMSALAEAGAQAVLRDWIQMRSKDAEFLGLAAFALASVDHPERETLEMLAKLSNSGDQQTNEIGTLSYGAALSKLAIHDPNQAEAGSVHLSSRLSSDDESVRRIGLLACGNAGLDSLLDAMLLKLKEGSESDRYYAASSLNKYRNPKVVKALLMSMETDPSNSVRAQAARAITDHSLADADLDHLVAKSCQVQNIDLAQNSVRALGSSRLTSRQLQYLREAARRTSNKDLKQSLEGLIKRETP